MNDTFDKIKNLDILDKLKVGSDAWVLQAKYIQASSKLDLDEVIKYLAKPGIFQIKEHTQIRHIWQAMVAHLPADEQKQKRDLIRILRGMACEETKKKSIWARALVNAHLKHFFNTSVPVNYDGIKKTLDQIHLISHNIQDFGWVGSWMHACFEAEPWTMTQPKDLQEKMTASLQYITENFANINEGYHSTNSPFSVLHYVARLKYDNGLPMERKYMILDAMLVNGVDWMGLETQKDEIPTLWNHILEHPKVKMERLQDVLESGARISCAKPLIKM